MTLIFSPCPTCGSSDVVAVSTVAPGPPDSLRCRACTTTWVVVPAMNGLPTRRTMLSMPAAVVRPATAPPSAAKAS